MPNNKDYSWHDVVKECEKILELQGTATSPLSSNLPNIIRDWKYNIDIPKCVSRQTIQIDNSENPCLCQSYHERTGLHVEDCPLYKDKE